ncbi:CenpB-DNA-bind-domain-containing protein [Mycena vitilis]|nr:CenpB-DNA-bind-domain-containing protein [Mycena vitilis]
MQPAVYSPPFPPPWPNLYPDQVNDYPALHDPQVDSSIGPSRVLTRRQRAALEHAPIARRGPAQPYDERNQSMYISRPQTPPGQPEYPPQHEALSLSMPGAGVVQPSPTYHPLTPSSSSSPYSTYGFYSASHSRSNSISNMTNPRSASPALSTTSALTSVSSSGSGQNSFGLPPTPESLASRVKQKKQRLFNIDRKEICLYHKENPNARQEDIARLYGVERSTISKILKNKTKWLNVPADENLRIAKHRPSKFPEIEEDMVKWLLQCSDANTVLSDSMIRNKAKEIARDLGIPDERFKASSGWIENFKHRHGVRAGVWIGDGKNARTRSVGLGPSPDAPLLSPLNVGFQDHDDDMPDAPEPEPEEAPSRPSWLLTLPAESAPPPPQQQPMHVPVPPPRQQQPVHPSIPPAPHPSVPPSRQLADHGAYGPPPVTYGVMYEAPPRPAPERTTLAEAEDAINKVINFFDTNVQAQGILQANERNMLTTIKCALFQAASGIEYDRSAIPYEQPEAR